MNRSGASRITASPVMIGALTVIIAILAVFLAYNANSGLPFTPTYKVSAQVPNANTLVPGNEVRIGGVLVGQIESIEPVASEDGSATAKLDLRLDPEVEPLPTTASVIVRARSALGLKYLEIDPDGLENRPTALENTAAEQSAGEDPGVQADAETYPAGSLIPLSAAVPESVDIDQFLNMFDAPTRTAIQTNLREFGNALAGRGGDLNSAIGELQPLVRALLPVARLLSDPETRFDRFFPALERAASEAAPVAAQQAQMFVGLDQTFAALAGVARPFIQETITESVPTEETLIRTGPRIRSFLGNSAVLFRDLRPGARAIAENAPALEAAAIAGAENLPGAPAFNRRLVPLAQALYDFNNDARVRSGIDRLTETMNVLDPSLRFITPAQSVCNYGTLLFRNLASSTSQGDAVGRWQRFIAFAPATGGEEAGNEGVPSSEPADGPNRENYLHANPYPNTAAPGQTFECEAGNEPYVAGQQVIGNVPGNQGTSTEGQG